MQLSASSYLSMSLGLALFVVTAIGAFNYLVDPAGIYHDVASSTRSRPEILQLELIHKARAVCLAQADVLLMGSSRTAEGLDPLGPWTPPRTYNLGLPQGGLYEAWRYLQHACAVHIPRTVVLGVEYSGAEPDRAQADAFSDDRLIVQPDGRPTSLLVRTFTDIPWTLFSVAMAKFSWATLQAPSQPRMTFRAGFEADAPLVAERLDLAANVRKATRDWVGRVNPGPFRYPNGQTPQMEPYKRILVLCAEKNIRLIVFTQPLNAVMLDKYTAREADYREWMEALTSDLESTPGLQGEVWDFAGYNSISTEAMPSAAETYSHLRYYWEGSHYRKVVGDDVQQRIFQGNGPDGFGQPVTSATVDDDVRRLLAEKKAWHDHGQAVDLHLSVAK